MTDHNMHSWFTQKMNEMIGLAHYCQFSVLKAHFHLTQRVVDETFDKETCASSSLKQILPLLIREAEHCGKVEAAGHLQRALELMETTESDDNVIPVDFTPPLEAKDQQR